MFLLGELFACLEDILAVGFNNGKASSGHGVNIEKKATLSTSPQRVRF